jgi:type VI secretion system protein ImpG
MDDSTWQPASSVLENLLSRGHEFSFVQVMRLARMVLGADMAPELPKVSWQQRLHIRPDLSLAFPASDVLRIERTGADGTEWLVTTTFLGLYGVSSPLPTHYTEDLMDEAAADSSVGRDFLDIFHQRLYQLYFECWSKYRLLIRLSEENNHLDRERLFCLIGLGEKELHEYLPDAWSLVRYAGLLTQFPRTAHGLRSLLRDALGECTLEVESCILRKAKIPVDQQMCLGIYGTRLGVDTFLGSEMSDRMGKFRIRIGPLSKEDFDNFLPGAARHDKLVRLVRLYMTDPLECELRIAMAAGQVRPIRLGDPVGPRLGLNAWCFSGDTLDEVSATYPLASVAASAHDAGFRGPTGNKTSTSLIDLYQQELAWLRDQAESYAKNHPRLSSMVSGDLADPDIERLLEGAAFVSANLQSKLVDDFPEIIQPLTEAFQPWHLRPIPATTIIVFTPKPDLVKPLLIPAGAEVASLPVQGIACRFRTCFDVTLHPLTLLEASITQPSGKTPRIELKYQLNGMSLSSWKTGSLRFFLGKEHSDACNLYVLLMRYLKRIVLTAKDCDICVQIPVECLKPVGFGAGESMLVTDSRPVPGHLTLQEYFLFPEKFLFFDLHGMERCGNLGSGSLFCITFELSTSPFPLPQVQENSFILSAVPVINLFRHKAKPLTSKADTPSQLVTPARNKSNHYHIYSVDRISELDMETVEEKIFTAQSPLNHDTNEDHICHISRTPATFGGGFDTWLTLKTRRSESPYSKMKLNIELTCTNGALPEQLGLGDVKCATATTPETVHFCNIKPVTAAIPPDTEPNRYWRILAGFSLNNLSLNGCDQFRSILHLYIPSKCKDRVRVEAEKKRIEGIIGISALATDRIVKGMMCRGYDVRMKVCSDHFSGPGDLFLFCSVLERFLGGYVTENCFVRLIVDEEGKGCIFEWPARLGDRMLT